MKRLLEPPATPRHIAWLQVGAGLITAVVALFAARDPLARNLLILLGVTYIMLGSSALLPHQLRTLGIALRALTIILRLVVVVMGIIYLTR